MNLPLTVTLERAEGDGGNGDDGGDEVFKEDFHIADIEDSDGSSMRKSDVILRLQTLKSEQGYWLDTGILTLPQGTNGGHHARSER